jgi:F0F1-type ATP synthase epsilon subunit
MRLLFDGDVRSVYLSGDEGEYEILPYHYPLLGALPEGEIRIAGFNNIGLRAGVVSFKENTCIILIEELDLEEARRRSAAMGDIEVLHIKEGGKKKKRH